MDVPGGTLGADNLGFELLLEVNAGGLLTLLDEEAGLGGGVESGLFAAFDSSLLSSLYFLSEIRSASASELSSSLDSSSSLLLTFLIMVEISSLLCVNKSLQCFLWTALRVCKYLTASSRQ